MSEIREYVQNHALFCHHDHTNSYPEFERQRTALDAESLLGYATADLVTADGAVPNSPMDRARMARLWPMIRVTGYGRATTLTCQALFGQEFDPQQWDSLTKALQGLFRDRTPGEIYDYCLHQKAQNRWTLQDARFRVDNPDALTEGLYPESFRFAFRMDELFDMVDAAPIQALERFTRRSIHSLAQLVAALNAAIDRCKQTGKLAAFKNGMAYRRDLNVANPSAHEAEQALSRLLTRKRFWDGMQQNSGAVDSASGRALGDYLLHCFIQRASDEDLPVQIHTGYLAGNWGSLMGTRAMLLIPILERYRRVRFDLFHASWPWTSELGALAKNYPNVWPDMCWAWTMNPAESERTLSEWIDGVPFNKIFAYGADTRWPWCDVGYALQAKLGIARVLESKIEAGYLNQRTAEEVADHIMLRNGEEFFGLA
jgi:predicted TIM-barrel fold metal-dependent hydrolase